MRKKDDKNDSLNPLNWSDGSNQQNLLTSYPIKVNCFVHDKRQCLYDMFAIYLGK